MDFAVRLPKQKRWYVCNLHLDERLDGSWLCKETPESKIHIILLGLNERLYGSISKIFNNFYNLNYIWLIEYRNRSSI